jgi:hypothetical protein
MTKTPIYSFLPVIYEDYPGTITKILRVSTGFTSAMENRSSAARLKLQVAPLDVAGHST